MEKRRVKQSRLRNLSLRKTIILYVAVSLVCSFLLSAAVVAVAERTQQEIWWKYVDEDEYFRAAEEELGEGEASPYYVTEIPRPDASQMTQTDHTISEVCDFLQTYAVLILSVLGSCTAVFLFYRNKLKIPLEELEQASANIAHDNLDFHITYENEDEMGHLCHEFERMRQQLSENNARLWRNIEEEKALRAAIAHDIRSPLSVLKGYQEMLIEYLPDETIDTKQAVEMLEESMKQIGRMDDFVESMRKMSSLETRQLQPGEITGAEMEEDLRAEIRILEKDAERTVSLKVSGKDENFCGDKEVILEVTENLLSNALRCSRDKVDVIVYVKEDELRIRVSDDGDGFQESTEKITGLYYRQNAKDSLKHTGMGMYISRLYCEKHGGQLLLENTEDRGAAVTAVFRRIA